MLCCICVLGKLKSNQLISLPCILRNSRACTLRKVNLYQCIRWASGVI